VTETAAAHQMAQVELEFSFSPRQRKKENLLRSPTIGWRVAGCQRAAESLSHWRSKKILRSRSTMGAEKPSRMKRSLTHGCLWELNGCPLRSCAFQFGAQLL